MRNKNKKTSVCIVASILANGCIAQYETKEVVSPPRLVRGVQPETTENEREKKWLSAHRKGEQIYVSYTEGIECSETTKAPRQVEVLSYEELTESGYQKQFWLGFGAITLAGAGGLAFLVTCGKEDTNRLGQKVKRDCSPSETQEHNDKMQTGGYVLLGTGAALGLNFLINELLRGGKETTYRPATPQVTETKWERCEKAVPIEGATIGFASTFRAKTDKDGRVMVHLSQIPPSSTIAENYHNLTITAPGAESVSVSVSETDLARRSGRLYEEALQQRAVVEKQMEAEREAKESERGVTEIREAMEACTERGHALSCAFREHQMKCITVNTSYCASAGLILRNLGKHAGSKKFLTNACKLGDSNSCIVLRQY